MESILVILLIITLINTIGISGMLVNKRRKEIVIRKIVGASNLKIAGVFFGELFIIGVVSMVLAVCVHGVLSMIFNGYILNISIALSLSNFYSSILVTVGMTLVTTFYKGEITKELILYNLVMIVVITIIIGIIPIVSVIKEEVV